MKSNRRYQRKRARLALTVHSALAKQAAPPPLHLEMPASRWQRCISGARMLRLAQERNYRAVAAALQDDLQQQLAGLETAIKNRRELIRQSASRQISPPGEIYQDLLDLEDVFPAVVLNLNHGMIQVTTEPITLKERYLGPFRIDLTYRHCSPFHYRIFALDPRPAASDPDTVHPHVQGGSLCEGDGAIPIRAALREGRLLDFFQLVNAVLHTYNPGSPYIRLEFWDGIACRDCGETVAEDDVYSCAACEAALCDQCGCGCQCGSIICSACSRRCENCCSHLCSGCVEDCCGCHESFCSSCLRNCRDCDESLCSSCLHDDERCQSCHETFQQEQADCEESDAAV